MARRKTHEEFVSEVKALVGDEYVIKSNYIDAVTRVSFMHTDCGHLYDVFPSKFTSSGQRCPRCAGNQKKTHCDFVQEVFKVVGDDYKVIGKYVNANTKILITHITCGSYYEVIPYALLQQQSRCPTCRKVEQSERQSKTNEEFTQQMITIVGKEYVVLGVYKNAKSKVAVRHEVCGSTYNVTPDSFLRGSRCPKCFESKGEKAINVWLTRNNITFTPQYKIKYSPRKRSLRLDFYVRGVAIEYDGRQHYEAIEA